MSDELSPRKPEPVPPSEARPDAPRPIKDERQPPAPDPTRYGDWEKNGRCIDF